MKLPSVIEVIVSDVQRGRGEVPNPIRRVLQIHDKEGNLIAENDPERLFTYADVIEMVGKGLTSVDRSWIDMWLEDNGRK